MIERAAICRWIASAVAAAITSVLPAAFATTAASGAVADVVAPQEVVPGVWLIPGGLPSDRQPDGNTVVFGAPRGLVVVDTGRHASQRDAILGLARARKLDIAAIINTHWHLDHVSGNPALRQAYPGLSVYASNAIDDALRGFLAQSARDAAGYLKDESIPASMREDIAADAATVENGQALRPDIVIDQSGPRDVGGRTIEFHLVRDAVTAGDLWLYDPRSKLAVLGDLVTLPAPFLDTACPQGWLEALRDVDRKEFQVAIPGHGVPMSRAQVGLYREALGAFIDCAASNSPKADCSTRWLTAIAPLLSGEPNEAARAQTLTNYYVDMLRANGGRSAHCAASAEPPAH